MNCAPPEVDSASIGRPSSLPVAGRQTASRNLHNLLASLLRVIGSGKDLEKRTIEYRIDSIRIVI